MTTTVLFPRMWIKLFFDEDVTWHPLLTVGSRDSSLFHRARRQTACPGSGPQRRAAVAGDTFACNFCHLLLEGRGSEHDWNQSHQCLVSEETTKTLSGTGVVTKTAWPLIQFPRAHQWQSSFLILTLTEISKAGVKHTYLGQIALTRREPLATDDACLIDRAGGGLYRRLRSNISTSRL